MTNLSAFHSELLSTYPKVKHAFFSRQGGASTGLLSSLNFSLSKGDTIESIQENRRKVAAYYGDPSRLPLYAKQVHGCDVQIVERPFDFSALPEIDGLITKTPNLVIGVQTADCIPLILFEPQHRIAGAIHVGWKGAHLNIIHEAVAKMVAIGAQRKNIIASIGPCIHQESYEVDKNFFDKFIEKNKAADIFFEKSKNPSHFLFDLPGFAKMQLNQEGITLLDQVPINTYTSPELFYSCRRAFHKGETTYGCTLATIMIES